MVTQNQTFEDYFDCIVMLTMSNWHTEPRSNRYHYATRFAEHLPVIFVQADRIDNNYVFELIDDMQNFEILHVSMVYDKLQAQSIAQALEKRNYEKPLLWIYNPLFYEFINCHHVPFRIYHATEDYYSHSAFKGFGAKAIRILLTETLKIVDLVIAVSQGVLNNCIEQGQYTGKSLVLRNGCDISLWGSPPQAYKIPHSIDGTKKIIFYQGGINRRLDYKLIEYCLKQLQDWEFWFVGHSNDPKIQEIWNNLLKYPNIKYFGELDPVDVKNLAYSATVGIMPFLKTEMIVKRSLPLKAFEYVAVGLPVVTITIDELKQFNEFFEFKDCKEDFANAIQEIASTRYDLNKIEKRISVASLQDYNIRFASILPQVSKQFEDKPHRDSTSHTLNNRTLFNSKNPQVIFWLYIIKFYYSIIRFIRKLS